MTTRDPKTGRFPPRPGKPKGGEGWGGAAKGEGQRVPLDEVRPLRWDKDNLAQKEEVAAEMRGVLYHVAKNGDAEAVRVNAADKLLDRIEGKPVQRQDVTSKGERLGYVITAPAEAEDATAWAEQHQPKQ